MKIERKDLSCPYPTCFLNNCSFSHSSGEKMLNRVCRKYLLGKCKNKRCKYTHNSMKECSICFNLACDFGLLENCDHIVCLSCAKRWIKIQKTCPVCRLESRFFVYSKYWTTSREKIIENVKKKFKTRQCKEYTNNGFCSFQNCLFNHEFMDTFLVVYTLLSRNREIFDL